MQQESDARPPDRVQMLEELVDVTVGLGILLVPLLTIALPGVILLLVLPVVLLLVLAAAPVVPFAVVALPGYLLVRWLRRRRQRRSGEARRRLPVRPDSQESVAS